MKKTTIIVASIAAALASVAVYAQTAPAPTVPAVPGEGGRHGGPFAGHPELHKAAHHTAEAIKELTKAQENNHFDMEGHAAKAKQLLEEAEKEIHQAVLLAKENHKGGAAPVTK